MAATKNAQPEQNDEQVIARAKDFWTRYNKPIMIACAVIILGVGGWYGYKSFVKGPKDKKAMEAMFKAEDYFRMDSVSLALNGDGMSDGFLRIISKYKGTKAANLAHYYAGACYIRLNDAQKALDHLKKFSSDAKQVQARAYKLTADAYADLGKNSDALSYYKKAAAHFEKDEANASEYLFFAGYFAQKVMNNNKEAIAIYKELRDKFPTSGQARVAQTYLGQLGEYNID